MFVLSCFICAGCSRDILVQIYMRLSSANMLAVELIFLKVERNSSKEGRFYTRSI